MSKQFLFILFSLTILVGTISCDDKPRPKNERVSFSDTVTQPVFNSEGTYTEDSSMTIPQYSQAGEYKVEYGYSKYDEEKFGHSNPGYMRVLKGDSLIFEDSFKGEGTVFFESFGYQELAGKKLVFALTNGTEACDYYSFSRYYVSFGDKFYFLKTVTSFTGGDQYSSLFYDHIFPQDSAGIQNSILLVEGQVFYEHDQPDRSDTTLIHFTDHDFTMTKLTDNLSKVK